MSSQLAGNSARKDGPAYAESVDQMEPTNIRRGILDDQFLLKIFGLERSFEQKVKEMQC
jgi:hypothetical protein